MNGRHIALGLSKIKRFRVVEIYMRATGLLLCFVNQIKRVSTIARQLTRLNLSVNTQRTGADYVLQRGSVKLGRYIAVGGVGATRGLADLFRRQFLIFSRQCNDHLRDDGINDLASKVDGRARQGTNLRVARLGLNLRHQIALRT